MIIRCPYGDGHIPLIGLVIISTVGAQDTIFQGKGTIGRVVLDSPFSGKVSFHIRSLMIGQTGGKDNGFTQVHACTVSIRIAKLPTTPLDQLACIHHHPQDHVLIEWSEIKGNFSYTSIFPYFIGKLIIIKMVRPGLE